ncbi:hypothetical protein GQ42DRAFT_83618 [Ramicandelaber brevisporus]|nr:hypothetical protein GQ42DRAFT_83618 [Ramicandelaber brevisporus]
MSGLEQLRQRQRLRRAAGALSGSVTANTSASVSAGAGAGASTSASSAARATADSVSRQSTQTIRSAPAAVPPLQQHRQKEHAVSQASPVDTTQAAVNVNRNPFSAHSDISGPSENPFAFASLFTSTAPTTSATAAVSAGDKRKADSSDSEYSDGDGDGDGDVVELDTRPAFVLPSTTTSNIVSMMPIDSAPVVPNHLVQFNIGQTTTTSIIPELRRQHNVSMAYGSEYSSIESDDEDEVDAGDCSDVEDQYRAELDNMDIIHSTDESNSLVEASYSEMNIDEFEQMDIDPSLYRIISNDKRSALNEKKNKKNDTNDSSSSNGNKYNNSNNSNGGTNYSDGDGDGYGSGKIEDNMAKPALLSKLTRKSNSYSSNFSSGQRLLTLLGATDKSNSINLNNDIVNDNRRASEFQFSTGRRSIARAVSIASSSSSASASSALASSRTTSTVPTSTTRTQTSKVATTQKQRTLKDLPQPSFEWLLCRQITITSSKSISSLFEDTSLPQSTYFGDDLKVSNSIGQLTCSWQHPSNPHSPAQSENLTRIIRTGRLNEADKIEYEYLLNREKQWTDSLQSVFDSVYNNNNNNNNGIDQHLPSYFYIIANDFVILFHGKLAEFGQCAWISQSTRGFRRVLRTNGVRFTLPFASDAIQDTSTDADDDDVIADNSPHSALSVQGMDAIECLLQFMLKWTDPDPLKRAWSPPLLLSPCPFTGAVLRRVSVEHSVSNQQTDAGMNVVYRTNINCNAILPHVVPSLLRGLSSLFDTATDYTMSMPATVDQASGLGYLSSAATRTMSQ